MAPVYDIPSTVVYGDKTLALTLGGKRTGVSRRHKASGPLVVDLESGAAFAAFKDAGTHDGGASPFPGMLTRAWVKELKHRRRMLEG